MVFAGSQPARAVWIEIIPSVYVGGSVMSQPARAVWIEITGSGGPRHFCQCHSLRGLCGLKYVDVSMYIPGYNSHSLRGLCGLKF